ncbi:hypothetical protein K440DRAFT_634574 [Wilcoxina mikolae CBS 423.85]|nr:hypothetical protein K440DRAFT_634574 [Wilcoxina mikolae CBS 423.85]
MKPSVHRFILPPVLLGVHLLLLLPLFLAPQVENPGQAPVQESQEDDGQEPLLQRLHLKYSIPLGLLGFAGVHVLKQLAGEVPLPKDPRRIRLAARIEQSVLFGLGVVEEIWRWGVVRVLITLEGGKGGFRGRGELWDLLYASWMGNGGAAAALAADGFGIVSPTNTKYPTIWEGVYLMGWTWSLVETALSWYSVRPTSAREIRRYQETRGVHGIGDSPRRPLLGKRTRCSDYSTIQTSDDNANTGGSSRAGEHHSFFECLNRKRRDLGSPRSGGSRTAGRRGARGSGGGGDLTIQFAPSPHVEGSSSTTACDDSLQASSATPKAFGKAVDMEQGEATPRACRDFRVQPLERQDGISDNDYGDDEGSLSDFGSDSGLSSQSSCSGRVAPLLSSSLPYDPEQHHPHHEHVPHRQTSHSTLGDAAAAVLSSSVAGGSDDEDDRGDEIVEIHEDDYQGVESQQSEPNPIGDAIPITPSASRSPQRRIYPSFPSYSASYNQSHFPQPSGGGGGGAGSSSNTTTTTAAVVTARYHHSYPRRRVYGVSVDRLHAYLPVMWRTAALLRHIGHAMFFAWAPTLVFQGRFQWWCFLVLVTLAVRKGWNTVEWFGGSASRAGLLKSSTLLLGISTAIYLVSLDLWGLLW